MWGIYRLAAQLKPDDRITARLLRAAERRQQVAQDEDQQVYLDHRVAVLLQQPPEARTLAHLDDEWTSTSPTLAVLYVQNRGPLSPRAGEEAFIVHRLTDALRESGRIRILNRELLDALLTKLQLSPSALVDPPVALRVGRILTAQLIATGRIVRSRAETTLSVNLIEITTNTLSGQANATGPSGALDSITEQLARALLQQIRHVYPLRGRISRVSSQAIVLNIGSDQGLTPGLTLEVFDREAPGLIGDPVGLIEVTTVAAQQAQARVLQQAKTFQPGWKVRESVEE